MINLDARILPQLAHLSNQFLLWQRSRTQVYTSVRGRVPIVRTCTSSCHKHNSSEYTHPILKALMPTPTQLLLHDVAQLAKYTIFPYEIHYPPYLRHALHPLYCPQTRHTSRTNGSSACMKVSLKRESGVSLYTKDMM